MIKLSQIEEFIRNPALPALLHQDRWWQLCRGRKRAAYNGGAAKP